MDELGDRQSANGGCRSGYAAVRVDGRGSGKSPGQCEPWSLAEAIDFYDAIEWAAAQPWCNGKVGLSGISYFAINQWFVANLQPPSLKAIIPWEGFADLYRDALFHGGHAQPVHDQLVHRAPDAPHGRPRVAAAAERLADQHAALLARATISTAAPSAARRRSGTRSPCRCSRSATGPAWRCICAATPKRSCAPPRSTRSCACRPARMCIRSTPRRDGSDQLRFFDYWLKGIDNGVMDEPPVKLAIRKGRDEIEWRHEHEWPLARTQWTEALFRPVAAGGRHAGECRRARLDQSGRRRHSRTYPATSLGSMGSTSAASSQVMGGGIKPGMGISLETPPLPQRRRGHRPARRQLLGVELDRGHGPVPHAAQLRCRRQRGAGDRPAGHAGAGGEGLAARLAPRARSRALAAVPALSQAHAGGSI